MTIAWLKELDRLEASSSRVRESERSKFHPSGKGAGTVNTRLACLLLNHARDLIDAKIWAEYRWEADQHQLEHELRMREARR